MTVLGAMIGGAPYVAQQGPSGILGLAGAVVFGLGMVFVGVKITRFGGRVSRVPGCACGGPGPRKDWHQGAGTYVVPCSGCGRR
jgi:hypothetical protein